MSNTSQDLGQTFQCRVTSEAVKKVNTSQPQEVEYVEEIDESQLESVQPRNKILIQRVFHQPKKGVVEQKLDYIVATSDEDITRHVFGGLFENRYYSYKPEDYCRKHDPNLEEYIDESMPKLGDKFDSLETFRLYVDSHAKKWKYYVKCADSHTGNGKFTYIFRCVFNSPNVNYNAKGLRKRTAKLPRGNCPCRVQLKPVPQNSNTLTVIYVCNHHDHPISDEYFEKLQHGRRIHPSIKEEIMDFLSLDVDRYVVKKHFETLTGVKMNSLYFNNLLNSMKKNNMERQFTLERLKEIAKTVRIIKEQMGLPVENEEENVDDDLDPTDKAKQIEQAMNVLKALSAPSKPPPQTKIPNAAKRRLKLRDDCGEDENEMPPVSNKSRLETRLQELTYDHETLESIKHLQDSVRGETDEWSQIDVDNWNRSITGYRKKRIKNAQKHMPVIEYPDLEPQTVVIENTQNVDSYAENQEIVYDNQIVMEAPVENCNEIILYQNEDANNETQILQDENGVNYCLQYEDNAIFIENLENVPEVRIQATDLATVSIVSQNEEPTEPEPPACESQVKKETLPNEVKAETQIMDIEANAELPDSNNVLVKEENIQVLGDGTGFELGSNAVYEVIETNDRKLYPSRELFKKSINKTTPRKRSSRKAIVFEDDTFSTDIKDDSQKLDSQQTTSDAENLNNLLNDHDLETLDDDDYYMVVVNKDEMDGQSDVGEYDKFENELMKETHIKTERCTDDAVKNSSDVMIEEKIEDDNERVVYLVNKKIQCDVVSADAIDREMLTISGLKRIKRSLERDIKQLVSTKNRLVKEIMQAKKSKRSHSFFK